MLRSLIGSLNSLEMPLEMESGTTRDMRLYSIAGQCPIPKSAHHRPTHQWHKMVCCICSGSNGDNRKQRDARRHGFVGDSEETAISNPLDAAICKRTRLLRQGYLRMSKWRRMVRSGRRGLVSSHPCPDGSMTLYRSVNREESGWTSLSSG